MSARAAIDVLQEGAWGSAAPAESWDPQTITSSALTLYVGTCSCPRTASLGNAEENHSLKDILNIVEGQEKTEACSSHQFID